MQPANASDRSGEKACRELAAEILRKVDTRKAYADLLLDNSLRESSLSARDRALLTELVYGTLRWQGRIDWHLGRQIHRPLARTDPYLRSVLRLALFQILFLDRVPDYAAVNEAVEQAKAHGGKRAAGFVNGVLRKCASPDEKGAAPTRREGIIHHLAVAGSHPEWLVKRWLSRFGPEETEALLKANNEAAKLTLRANRMKTTRGNLVEKFIRMGLEAAPARWAPQGIVVRGSAGVERLPGFEQALFQVQGEASQLVGHLLDPQPGERILDGCAAPGGKATHLAELMGDRGEIVATDIAPRGLEKLRENVQRLGLSSIRCVRANVLHDLEGDLEGPYDRALLDAPCSALGTLRSHPEAKWHRGDADVGRLSKLQRLLLGQVSRHLKPGAALVYATCTLTREENEAVVEDFLEANSEFILEDAANYLPGEAKSMTSGPYLVALPHRHDTEGFFAARLKKRG